MEEVKYSIYSIYTADNKIYIGLSKNPKLRIHQHWYKSSNERLRALVDDPSVQLFSRILRSNLTLKEANELEKLYIAKYRNDSNYTVLNILSGGRAINIKIKKPKKISRTKNSKKLRNDEIIKIRYKYAYYHKEIVPRIECKKYNLSKNYFMKILRGKARRNLPGPLLGKDYTNG